MRKQQNLGQNAGLEKSGGLQQETGFILQV